MLEKLKEEVLAANLALVRAGLVTLTWGNASGVDRGSGLVVIKPSGVPYDKMRASDMVVVDLQGNAVEGELRPSSDLPTHLELYRQWLGIGGVVHTHSAHSVAFAQARCGIECYGTTHADHFHGAVPCTRPLTREEVEGAYELNTGKVIVERFAGMNPLHMPAVVVASHGPFTWGKSAMDAVNNAIALEEVARMAILTRAIAPEARPADGYIIEKHFSRKHGPNAYYGQATKE